ncbi:carbohydrate ABC transporter substrate-binding protein (CUT1 family) [Cytobacillus firmus]|uniref:Carbohydrate ABC transporter substrate-binding protein (CUT1 family) n=2 Tax=Cytobacillus TaxID=2675230 RepID=A0A366JS11_CYTFI|nr:MULTISPECIES: extracellular solute-binding protein [Cytobacillus]RBP90635.1 carbohydrate ABC transporter substrate-binding protein (CUT1 family) [Cytobacillus firmus]TDX46217.1 carbohydrate ABC transporter substrate-binding protein (CUT1 family) [Cytobacillus oceanisediminis]
MPKKAHSFLLIAVMILAAALAGCSGNTDTASGENGSKKTIKFMHLWPAGSSKQQNQIVTDIIEQYEAEHEDVKIEVEVLENEQYKNKIKVLSSSNELPDVGFTWAAGYMTPFVKGSLFAELDDVLNDGLKESFVSGTTEAYALDGKSYGLPLELNIAPIYYNKEIFEKYNLDVPQTYSEFENAVKTLTDNGVAPIALGNKDRWTGSLWYMYLADRIGGAEVLNKAIDRSGSFEDPALVSAAEEIQNLVKENAFNKGYNGLSNDEGKAEFLNGNAAMYLMGTWELPNFTTNEEIPQDFRDSVGFFKFPTVDGGKGNIDSWVGGPGVGLFVAENSKVKDESKEFVKFFVEKWGEQSVEKAGVIPATKVDTGKVDLPDLYIDVLNELNKASSLTLFADVQMSASVAETHLNLIQSLFGNEVKPADYAKQHEEALKAEEGN